ncbi:protein of unknown function [Taphrina deformans PYCC 5710]|uniref:Bms1-type G domain-containing protein n=1 Tax=Taphrina deformans (strain PYCC 5710 / ATCC 11124 / CBS 356.35 / IMI 108563 / JCM 9778 / NBRC 8474) TaxID=1097556 RepID=R4XDQ5_TAPDE|nr:protein of unknown function [Taphrina deformans PYCC 5710]|eukprot:CCG83752.1 protein of unknown function [Taphrina deformans PYCC 5710]
MSHSHRPTTKQKHKPFKSGHASSRTLKDISKGKIQQEKAGGCVQKVHTKKDRKNLAKQIQQNKKNALKAQAGFFGDGRNKASRVCAIISLSTSMNPKFFVNGLQEFLEEPVSETANANVHIKNFKQRLQFVVPQSSSLLHILDAASIADTVIFLISAGEPLIDNTHARETLRALQSQGIPSHFSVIPDLKYDPDSMIERTEKRCLELRKMWEADLAQFFPVHHATSLYVMDSTTEITSMLRTLCTTIPDSPTWRSSRTYMLPSARDFDADGNFVVEGIVRGGSLSPDRTVHIPALGDFQIARITSAPVGIEEEDELATPSEKHDSLSPVYDDLDMDAPDPDDLIAEEQMRRGVRLDDHYYLDDGEEEVPVVKKVPRGTSEYQATWITDENALNSDEDPDVSDDESMDGNASDDERMTMGGGGAPSTYAPTQFEETHQDLSEEEEARQLADYRAQVKEDKEFPDEVDFDPSTTARERFRKYRGLRDFHQSEWDPEETEPNTPGWYRQILKFANYKATRNRIFKAKGPVAMGSRVRIYIKDVPRSILEREAGETIVWMNRELEQSRAVNHFTFQLEPGMEPIKSKADMMIQVGHRRFMAQPIFSQAINRTRNGLVRYERFAQPGRISFATIAGPAIIESGVPVLFFRPSPSSEISASRAGTGTETAVQLVGTGSFAGINHARLSIKRILLSATPFKIHKRLVTARYMFHSREDVNFFKAVQLTSKYGRTGYIKEPLGTHGYMKTTWDKQLQGVDTILMPLYKRIYPREARYYRS